MELNDEVTLAELKQIIGDLSVRNFAIERELNKLMKAYAQKDTELAELKNASKLE